MIELNINDGSYDRIFDSLIETVSEDENSPLLHDATAPEKSNLPVQNIFAMAQGIVDRGNSHRSFRRSSSIL